MISRVTKYESSMAEKKERSVMPVRKSADNLREKLTHKSREFFLDRERS